MPKLPKASLLNLNFLDGMLFGIDKVSDCINSIESLMILISSVSINIANRCLAGCQVAISRAILHFIPHDFLTMTPITISMHATREQPHPIPSHPLFPPSSDGTPSHRQSLWWLNPTPRPDNNKNRTGRLSSSCVQSCILSLRECSLKKVEWICCLLELWV